MDKKINELVKKLMQNKKTYTEEELLAIQKKEKERQSSPEYIDQYIYNMEHNHVLDGIVDWKGCNINENWENYKEQVGYYKRHPECEQESKAFTAAVMEWWKQYYQKIEENPDE